EYLPGEKHTGKTKGKGEVSDRIDAFPDAGYILEEHDLILDFDDVPMELLDTLIEKFDIITQMVRTNRGLHMYFRKPKGFKGAKSGTAVGIPVEYKHAKNTASITVKQNGVERKVINKGVFQGLPDFLKWDKRLTSLIGLDEGDGRNPALFEHRMKIRNVKDWQKCLHFVNEHVFAEPLDAKEMETICRDVNIKLDDEDAESQIASLLLQEYSMVLYLDTLYWKNNGEYTDNLNELRRLVYEYSPGKKTRFVDEVIKQIEYRCREIDANAKFDIQLNNGILRDGKFIAIQYQEFTPFTIDLDFKADAPPVDTVDDYIDQLTGYDPKYRELLLEVMAHSLIVDKEFKRLLAKFFIMVGDGGNGKGSFLQVMRSILGGKNCTALSIQNMTDERYFTTMQGKLANLGDDIQDEPLDNEQMKLLKNISTCDYVSTRQLFKQSREVELTLSLVFTSNHVLKSFEKGESYKRRVIWMPMYSKPKKKDPKFISKLTTPEALEYWMRLMIEGYYRLYGNQTFTDSPMVQKYNNDYHEENDGTLIFIRDHQVKDFEGKKSPTVYEEYETWAIENGINPQSRKALNTSIESELGLKIKSVWNKTSKETERTYQLISEVVTK
uniref:DUF5906 domain-containing protein n=1 Tax=Carnobacterium jeotgali TaxID=545534 RepID=UPI00388DC213